MPVVYSKTGERVYHLYAIDARECVASGEYTFESPPESAKTEADYEPDASQIEKVKDIAERARLGEVVSPDDREILNEFQTNTGLDTPGAQSGVPAPEPVLVADVFNPATAGRAELFEYLRAHDVEVGNASGTELLREEATQVFLSKSK